MSHKLHTGILIVLVLILPAVQSFSIAQNAQITYSFSSPVKDYTHKVFIEIKGVTTASKISFVSNFDFTTGFGACFGDKISNFNITTVSNDSHWMTTMQNKNTTKGLDLTATCELTNTNSSEANVLPGVAVPLIYSLTVDGVSASIYKPCSTTGCADPGNGFAIGGYYAQWSVWGREYNPYHIPYDKMNQIFYAFVGFDSASGQVKTLDPSADTWGMTAIATALLQYPYLQAYLSFGGWTNTGKTTAPMFEALASSQAYMDKFAQESINLMRKLGFTGIDIDWQWWSDYSDKVAPAKKTLSLIKTLRKALDAASLMDNKQYRLTMAINAGTERAIAMQDPSNPNSVGNFWEQIGVLVDQLNLMSYDYHGGYDTGKPAYFHANYDFPNVGNYNVGVIEGWCIKDIVAALSKFGVSARSIVMGIPLYVRTMKVASSKNGGLFETVMGPGAGDYQAGIFDYKCLVNPVGDPATGCGTKKAINDVSSFNQHYDTNNNIDAFNTFGRGALQPWAFSSTTSSFATFDNEWSVSQKINLVRSSRMGGVMYWQIDGDASGDRSLIARASAGFKNPSSLAVEF